MSNRWGGRDYNYREEYFRRNKGFLGFYICAYCYRPVRRKNAHVDHIYARKAKGLIKGPNAYFNTIVSCSKCNLKKSNKIDHRVIQGYGAKVVQETFRAGKGAVSLGTKGSFTLIGWLLGIVKMILNPIIGLILFVLKKVWWILVLLLLFWLGPELVNYIP